MEKMTLSAAELPGLHPEFQRLGLLLGEKVLSALEQTRVVIVGLGGVGSWAAEALVRSGIGHITIVDNDSVCITNINRQIQALHNTIGFPKATALMKRLLQINPRCNLNAFDLIFSRETASLFGIEKADYVIDAIDSLNHKLDLIQFTQDARRPILFSSMGMARRLDPTRLKTEDIWKTKGCPFARLVRYGLRKRAYSGCFTAVYSDERAKALCTCSADTEAFLCACSADTEASFKKPDNKKSANGSAVTVTAAAGMILASLVLRDVYGDNTHG